MFTSVDYTVTLYQGCGTPGHPYACPYGWCKALGIPHAPELKITDWTLLVPPSIEEAVIFVNSAHDWLAPVIPSDWILELLKWIGRQNPSLEFLLQSKWPLRAYDYPTFLEDVKDRVILATTIETDSQEILNGIGCLASPITERAYVMATFKSLGYRTRLSLEPLFKFNPKNMAEIIRQVGPEIIEIGLDNYSHRHHLIIPQPRPDDVQELITSVACLKPEPKVNLKTSIKEWLKREG
jgi:DNA repair photolyase